MFDVIQNRRVVYGPGTIRELPGILRELTGNTVMVIAYSDKADCVRLAVHALEQEGLTYVLDASLRGEPSTDDIDRLADIAVRNNCGAVLAIGGGSVMDAGKAVAMLCTNGGNVEQYQMEGKPISVPALPVVAVPTTSGTGSEATKVSVVYNPANKLKKSFYSPSMIAGTVILDPELTVGLPKDITVSTGIDALSHAIESYVSLKATPYTEMFSLQAMKLIVENLEKCVRDPNDVEARGGMLLASYLGGCALNAGIGLAHILAQPLGGLIKIPHGVACAIFLPYAMEHNVGYCTKKYCDIARIFDACGEDGSILAQEGIARVKAFLKRLNAPDSIRQYLPEDFNVEKAADIVLGATGHIKNDANPVTRNVIINVIRRTV